MIVHITSCKVLYSVTEPLILAVLTSLMFTKIIFEAPNVEIASDVSDGTVSFVTYNKGACFVEAITAALAADKPAEILS